MAPSVIFGWVVEMAGGLDNSHRFWRLSTVWMSPGAKSAFSIDLVLFCVSVRL